ncbi:hypothetical protein JKP88DRAFT_265505 [Tribonema minus]|uniref:Uncharacterized protein n=1 Tax=Tribonema minus TaxID=303371 RepID=A0A836C8M7_9STRA|nr:hypothetical protein JKP88DRAFT_265505 [Tribonema minus]
MYMQHLPSARSTASHSSVEASTGAEQLQLRMAAEQPAHDFRIGGSAQDAPRAFAGPPPPPGADGSGYSRLSLFDWRRFRAKLIAGSEEAWHERLQRNVNPRLKDVETWAHELAAPEPGCLLLASPDHFTGQESQYSQAVIFLVQHNANGSVGFVLNRPTQFTIGTVTTGMEVFNACPLMWGGDLGRGTVQMVHAFDAERMPGARKIIDGVYVGGGVLDAQEAVARGQAKPGDFKFFLQLFGKAPGHLQAEMDAGKWICAATSKELILKPCINLPVPLWREVLTLMGGKHSILGRLTYGDL